MCAGRNSIGFELEDAFLEVFDDRIDDVPALSRSVGRTRLERHRAFVERRREDGHAFEYEADHYETPVMTDMERVFDSEKRALSRTATTATWSSTIRSSLSEPPLDA